MSPTRSLDDVDREHLLFFMVKINVRLEKRGLSCIHAAIGVRE